MTNPAPNPQFAFLAEIVGDQPGVTIHADDDRARATLVNPNGWSLTVTSKALIFERPDGAWAAVDRGSKSFRHMVKGFSRGNAMKIPWQQRG